MKNQITKRQQMRYMGYNLLAFTIIFGLFGTIIYFQIYNSLFFRIDGDLEHAREKIMEMPGYIDFQISDEIPLHDRAGSELVLPDPKEEVPKEIREQEWVRSREFINAVPMRVQVIVRDLDGEVLNGHKLGRLFWDNIIQELSFSGDKLNVVQNFRLSDGSYFRSLSFLCENDGHQYYIQLMSTSDGEHGIVNRFFQILVVCGIVFVLLSICASYLLSRMNMEPVLRAWERQTEFVENASHELRTPLTIIQNKLESLLTTPGATILDKADNIAISLSETRRLSKLTGDLMTLARADSSEPLLQKDSFDIDALIQSVSAPFMEFAEAGDKRLELELHCGRKLTADRGRIHELMVILLDNALKYTKEGDSICIVTSYKDNKVEIRVLDTGIGIGEESLSRIFDRFYREDKARSRENGGTGLGLSIARWIVDSHGGTIRALQNKPKGTIFEVRLPK